MVEVPVQVGADRVLGIGFRVDPVLQVCIRFGLEQFLEDGSADVFTGRQQFPELPLSDHDDLHELVPGEAKDFLDLCGHFPYFVCDGLPVSVEQDRFLELVLVADHDLPPAFIVDAAENPVFCSAVGKREVHIGGGVFARIFTGKVLSAAVAAAGRAVKGIDDGVEQGGLPRAGVSGDKVQSAVSQL